MANTTRNIIDTDALKEYSKELNDLVNDFYDSKFDVDSYDSSTEGGKTINYFFQIEQQVDQLVEESVRLIENTKSYIDNRVNSITTKDTQFANDASGGTHSGGGAW